MALPAHQNELEMNSPEILLRRWSRDILMGRTLQRTPTGIPPLVQ
jgi:hypothetical protein